jgi:DNA-binding GntR family transcriptional regulator
MTLSQASKSPPAAPPAARLDREPTRDQICERIYTAVVEHRLQPGTQLVEERLAEIFGVGRTRIREVLAQLAHAQVVELIPQRGAYVAKPSVEQAFDVFEARRLIEPALVRRLIDKLTPGPVARLRQHLALELAARGRDDKRAIVRLSGEFHTLLAEQAGNTALMRQMRELTTLTCLIIVLYDAPTAETCRADEHLAIVDAIADRDVARAERLVLEHLNHIERGLRFEPAIAAIDLEAVFR